MRRRGRRAARGFTLIELTVALVAGLIVALGIVALSKEATRTFHEEVRASAAEATLRTAVDRLRADLQRAGYMSTGNIMGDTMIAHAPGATNVSTITAAMAGIKRLASIHLIDGGSMVQNSLTLSSQQTPALAPDVLEIGGNLTSSEEFEVELIQPAAGNCQRILLSASSPAMYRIAPVGSLQPGLELRNIFQPVPAGLSTQFIVRIVDDTGRSQYVATCPEAQTAGFQGTQPYLDVDAVNTPILTAQQTQTVGGVSGYASGRAWVNPVQIVRWEITTATLEAQHQGQYANALDNLPTQYGTVDPNKYDLMRTYVDATGNVIPQTSEIIAEYAVDLDFAFSVDNSIVGGTPNVVTFAFEDSADNDAWSYEVDTAPVAAIGPQRIRQVRARVVTRTAIPDRTVNVAVANYGSEAYTYRYCVNATPSCATNDGTLRWARARTVTTEVSLPNLQRDFF